MPRFIKCPVIVTAERFLGQEVIQGMRFSEVSCSWVVDGANGEEIVEYGDWVVAVGDERYDVYPNEDFKKRFQPVMP